MNVTESFERSLSILLAIETTLEGSKLIPRGDINDTTSFLINIGVILSIDMVSLYFLFVEFSL